MKILREWRKMYAPHDRTDDMFFRSDEWTDLRRQTFDRDKQKCLRCDKKFSLIDLNAHHMIPRAEGGADDTTNLVTLCEPCHDIVEIAEYRTKADIMASYDNDQVEKDDTPETEDWDDDPYNRPIWHRWVYGGVRHRL